MMWVRRLSFITWLGFSVASADEAQIAVAANFTVPAQHIATTFTEATGHTVTFVFGSTGKFYAQIKNGAPFDALLAADVVTPLKLAQEGDAIAASRFTYAVGKLVLWSATPDYLDAGKVLETGKFRHLAIANPKLAPYGAAALEVLTALGQLEALQSKLVQGESITQAYQFIVSGNAELGFIALSQVVQAGQFTPGSIWQVPETLYSPLRQDAILLTRGKDNAAAQAWLHYLKSAAAKTVIESFGYSF